MDMNCIDEEDEDVIVQGSSLYKHLHELGYVDFESITVPKSIAKDEVNYFKFSDIAKCVKTVFKKLFVAYSEIIQEDNVCKEQLNTILNAKVLLCDHASTVNDCLDNYRKKSLRMWLLKLIWFGTILSSSMYVSFNTWYKHTSRFALFMLICTSSMECTRVYAHRSLKSVVFLQNDLLSLYKKGLKILRYSYKIKLKKGNYSHQFYNLTADRLKYLQPLMETIIECLEHASCTYYHVSSVLVKLLPPGIFHEGMLTKFERNWFEIRGEINYEKLKNLYDTYILVQSEMLHLLAIAYDSCTWQHICNKVPELKLAYIVNFLVRYLTMYKRKVLPVIDGYNNCEMDRKKVDRYKRPFASRWQHLCMHLYLACNKLQITYDHILAILENIDKMDNDDEDNFDTEDAERRINKILKGIEAAKGFIEFSSLYLMKRQVNDRTENNLKLRTDISASVANFQAHITTNDSEPKIMDEVFEEYIQDEYLKPLIEETDAISMYNYKHDKSLMKNFMAELKDALVDKQKSMSERESKALERMYKNVKKETTSEDCIISLPAVPLHSSTILLTEEKHLNFDNETTANKVQFTRLFEQPETATPLLQIKECFHSVADEYLTKIEFNAGLQFNLAAPFSKANEEIFVGSGENSEDEEAVESKCKI